MCTPASGTLYKRDSATITINMFNDTNGVFKDNLLIKIKDHEVKVIPMDFHIKGTPVSLSSNQIGVDFNRQIPHMGMGAILHSNGRLTKTLKIVNNGPK